MLAIEIRRNTGIKGIKLPGNPKELKLTLYADDNNPLLTTQQSIVNLFAVLEKFRLASGCNINIAKTQGLTVGGAPIPDLPYPIEWNPEGGVRILGVFFHNKFHLTQKTTWEHIVQKMRIRAELLSTRDLSFFGKKININTLLLSKAWHVATVIPATIKTSKAIDSIIFAYLFSNKTPHLPSHDILKLNFHQGGIGVLDFNLQQKSLRMNRLRHVLDKDNKATWLTLPRLYLAKEILHRNNEWMFLENYPMIDYADPLVRYMNINMPFYLRELLEFLRKYKYTYLILAVKSTHTIYQMMLKGQAAATRIRSQEFWNTVTRRQLPWNRIWKTTFKSLFKGRYLNTYYKFLHNALPSGQKMSSSKRPYDTHCRRCHRYETTIHIFVQCPFAREVWNNYFYIYEAFLQRPQVSYIEALFSTALPKNKHERLLLLTITTIIVHELWRARCAQFHPPHTPTSVVASTRIINSKIKMIHFAYAKNDSECVKRLCLPSPICRYQNETFYFALPEPNDGELPRDSDFTSGGED